MYKTDPEFFNQDGSINFETACAAGRLERSKAARKVISNAWWKVTGTAKSAGRQIKCTTETHAHGTLKTS